MWFHLHGYGVWFFFSVCLQIKKVKFYKRQLHSCVQVAFYRENCGFTSLSFNGYIREVKVGRENANGYSVKSLTDIIFVSELEVKYFSRWKALEMWFHLHSTCRNYFRSTESEFCSKCYSHESRWCLCLSCSGWHDASWKDFFNNQEKMSGVRWLFSMWIFSETKTRKCCQYIRKEVYFYSLGFMQLEHDSASSALVQVISADHAKVFVFHIFGVLFDIHLVHNYFYSSLKSPL